MRIDAVAYEFGRLGGIIDVSLGEHERANTRHDRVVVGFRTSSSVSLSSRLLVTVVSATTSDFVQLSLVCQMLTPPPASTHPPAAAAATNRCIGPTSTIGLSAFKTHRKSVASLTFAFAVRLFPVVTGSVSVEKE